MTDNPNKEQAEAILRGKRLDATLMDYLVYMFANKVTEITATHIFNGCTLEMTFKISTIPDKE